MPPKVVQPVVEEVHQVEPVVEEPAPLESGGNGRFEYQDGTVYQGEWKIMGSAKVKHGNGRVIIASTLSNEVGQKEEYEGEWVEDRMEGDGTYNYKSGAQYSG